MTFSSPSSLYMTGESQAGWCQKRVSDGKILSLKMLTIEPHVAIWIILLRYELLKKKSDALKVKFRHIAKQVIIVN